MAIEETFQTSVDRFTKRLREEGHDPDLLAVVGVLLRIPETVARPALEALDRIDRRLNEVEATVAQQEPERDGWGNEVVGIERGMMAFLLGEGPLMGTWFGTGPPPGERGNFWWRKYLRTRPPEGESVEGEVKQSEDRWTISHDRLPNAWQPGTPVRITKLPQTGGNDGD